MASSIVLLLVLQSFWLVNSYDKAYNDLRRATSDIFRGTVLDLRDSILIRGFETTADSLPSGDPRAIFFSLRTDTGSKAQVRRRFHATTEIVVRGSVPDSTRDVLNAFSSSNLQHDGKQLVVRFTPDSIKVDTIARYFGKALQSEGIDLPFVVKAVNHLYLFSTVKRYRERSNSERHSLNREVTSRSTRVSWQRNGYDSLLLSAISPCSVM